MPGPVLPPPVGALGPLRDAAFCPCGRDRPYRSCCGRLHRGAPADTAEDLMRARYSAYALGDHLFVLDTWHPSTRPADLEGADEGRWVGLEVLAVAGGGPDDREGTVEFRAHHRRGSHAESLHERSRFTRLDGRWVYVDGE